MSPRGRAKKPAAFVSLGVILPLLGCGGAQKGELSGPVVPANTEVQTVVLDPTNDERTKGEAETVTITSAEGVTTWIESPAFVESGWSEGADGNPARYRVSFQGPAGEVAVYWIGTVKASPITYFCFGYCAEWWVAPATSSGEIDKSRHRVISDKDWQPMAREWYLAGGDE